jgi:hypothetical protein
MVRKIEDDEQSDDLAAKIEALPREVQPARDLWPAIAQGLMRSPRGATARRRILGLTGALAASLALALGLHGRPSGPPSPIASSSGLQGADATATPLPPLPGETDYEGAERALAVALDARRGSIPTADERVIDDSLRLFDEALAGTRQALLAHPDDADLRAELDRVWEDKIDLLRQATELPVER